MKSYINNVAVLGVLIVFFITACATRLDTTSPLDTDFSGKWLLNQSASQTVSIGPSGQQNSGMGGNSGGMGGGMGGAENAEGVAEQQPGGRNFGGPRLTPAMKSLEMTIEQNHDSMGIAYPDELYRDVDWGEKKFYRETVTAGWQGSSLIVKSSSDDMTITETYQLNSTKDILSLTISIKDQRGTNEFVRVFNLQK